MDSSSVISLDVMTTVERRAAFEAATYTTADEAYVAIGEVFASTGGYDDSVDREIMFGHAAVKLGVDYDALYYRWLNGGNTWGEAR